MVHLCADVLSVNTNKCRQFNKNANFHLSKFIYYIWWNQQKWLIITITFDVGFQVQI